MKKHIIYIITDSNRAYLEVGQCEDINLRLQEIKQGSSLLFKSAKLNNVVYLEEFDSYESASVRRHQLEQFTRMQRERLIRFRNPNWLNLQTSMPSNMQQQKAVVYA